MSMRAKFLLGMFLTISLLPLEARAHFCDDLWAGSYDLVVRPETDTVTLPASGAVSPATSLSKVDLPAPLTPITLQRSLRRIMRLRPS